MVGLVTEKQKDAETQSPLLFDSHVIHMDELGLSEESSLVLQVSDKDYSRKRKLTSAQNETLQALQKAIDEQGIVPGGKVPGSAVTEKTWREYAFNRTITASDSLEAKRKAFARSAKSLLEMGIIDKYQEYCWTTQDKTGQNENVPQKSQKTGVRDYVGQ